MKFLILFALLCFTALSFNGDENFNKQYQVKILNEGDYGKYPQKGDKVKVHYTGKLLDGTKFDSSVDRNQHFEFNVGTGRVIKCWDEVVSRMTLKDKVVVICPSNTAYGSRGAGGRIPPNSDLEFEIELFGFGSHKVDL